MVCDLRDNKPGDPKKRVQSQDIGAQWVSLLLSSGPQVLLPQRELEDPLQCPSQPAAI